MNDYFLITEQWLKTYTPISDFVDMEVIRPYFKLGEDIDVRQVIGSKLFDRLKQGTQNNNLTADKQELVTQIRPYLAYAIVARALPFIATGIRGAGVVKVNNPNIINATLAEVKDRETNLRNVADYYQVRLIQYLCDNGSKFHLYSQTGNPSADSTPNFISGFYVGCSCSGKCNCWK